MNKVLYAYAVNDNSPDSGAEAFLNLPATPYELLDAMDKLRLNDSTGVKFRVDKFYRFGYLVPFLSEPHDLNELNALAQKLSELDDLQEVAFEGLLAIECKTKKEPIELSDLIDLAYSTDRCHVVDDALNDSQLGRFCAESGFVPGAEDLPDDLYELLDFERIGREHRQREHGVLVERTADHPGGYVEQHSPLAEVYKSMDLTPRQPDYMILLETETGSQCRLPSAVLPQDRYTCLDCRVPALTDMISEAEDIHAANRLARRLSLMNTQVLNAYKALLEASGCGDISNAEYLADTLGLYIFSPQYSSPTEVAKGELSLILSEPDRALVASHLNLYQYGQALVEKCGGVLTDYGLIERKDGQPVQTQENQPKWGGMEMT